MTSRSRSSGDPPSVGSHVAFTASSPDQVNEFHTAALAAGGRDNGAPGERPYGGYYYAAFVLDPDGHNIEAVYHERRPQGSADGSAGVNVAVTGRSPLVSENV